MDLSIVIASYNEEQRLPRTLEDIAKFAVEHAEIEFEVVVVSDGSSDGTVRVVKDLQQKYLWLKLISYELNMGKGYAVKTGMLQASGRHVLFMDADNSTNVREYIRALSLLESSDVVIGSRYLRNSHLVKKQGLSRILISRMSNLLTRTLLGINIKDTQCGFKVFKQEHVKDIFSRQTINRFGFDMEIIMIAKSLGLKVLEMPVTWIDDPNTKVKAVQDTLRTLSELFRVRLNLWKGVYR